MVSMAGDDVWCRITLVGAEDATVTSWTLRGPGAPDLSVVDALGRLRLAVARLGWVLVLDEACSELLELLELAGLRREMER